MKILIAEDDASTRHILRSFLERQEHECLLAEDGRRAWELYLAQPVDVIISDWIMPGLSGLDLCKRVRKHGTDTYVYFVLLTVMKERPQVVEAVAAGADDYLVKPVDLEDLRFRLVVAARVVPLQRELRKCQAKLEGLARENDELRRRLRPFGDL